MKRSEAVEAIKLGWVSYDRPSSLTSCARWRYIEAGKVVVIEMAIVCQERQDRSSLAWSQTTTLAVKHHPVTRGRKCETPEVYHLRSIRAGDPSAPHGNWLHG